MKLTITVTEDQLKAVNAVVVDAQDWLQKAWDGKASSCTDRILVKKSDKNIVKLTQDQKAQEIMSLPLKTRTELDAEGNGELNI